MSEAAIDLLVLGWGYSARHGAARLKPRLASLVATAREADKARRMEAAGVSAIHLDREDADDVLARATGRASHVVAAAGPSEAGDPVLADRIESFRASARAGTRMRQARTPATTCPSPWRR